MIRTDEVQSLYSVLEQVQLVLNSCTSETFVRRLGDAESALVDVLEWQYDTTPDPEWED